MREVLASCHLATQTTSFSRIDRQGIERGGRDIRAPVQKPGLRAERHAAPKSLKEILLWSMIRIESGRLV